MSIGGGDRVIAIAEAIRSKRLAATWLTELRAAIDEPGDDGARLIAIARMVTSLSPETRASVWNELRAIASSLPSCDANDPAWTPHVRAGLRILATLRSVRSTDPQIPSVQQVAVGWDECVDLDEDAQRTRIAELVALHRETVTLLARAAARSADAARRQLATVAFGALISEPADVLIEALNDPVAEVRLAALRSLAQRRQPAIIEDVASRLGDPRPEVRAAAVGVLDRFGSCAISVLLRAAADPVDEVSSAARASVLEHAADDVIPEIVAALADDALADAASAILLQVGDRCIEHLLDTLDAPTPTVRGRIGSLLRSLGAGAYVRRRMNDLDPRTRRRAAEGLAVLGSRDASTMLLTLMDDPDPSLRIRATELIAELGDPSVKEELGLIGFREPNPVVAAAITRARQYLDHPAGVNRTATFEEHGG
jgi:HEAT repeat protein